MTFLDLLKQYSIPYKEAGSHHHVTSGWIGIDCPHCSPGWQHYRLGYNVRGGYLTCWACGPKRLVPVISELTGMPPGVVGKLVSGLERDVLPAEFRVQGKYTEPKGVEPLTPKLKHWQYLIDRGFWNPEELVRLWAVKAVGRQFNVGWRLFIPVYYRSEAVSWTTRSLVDHGLRYVSAKPSQEKYPHKELLYGEDYARSSVVVCEGPLDVWKIGPGAVCTFGTSFSQAQVYRLSKYPRRYVCFDQEPEARQRAQSLAESLSVFDGETHVLELETGKDPGSCDESELHQIRRLLS